MYSYLDKGLRYKILIPWHPQVKNNFCLHALVQGYHMNDFCTAHQSRKPLYIL